MLMDNKTTHDFLFEHIPYRLGVIDSYCSALLMGVAGVAPAFHQGAVISSEFQIPTLSGMRYGSYQQLLNLAYEAGPMSYRLLLEACGLAERQRAAGSDDFRLRKATDRNKDSGDVRISNIA